MKRHFRKLSVVLLIISFIFSVIVYASNDKTNNWGDVDGDGEFTIVDYNKTLDSVKKITSLAEGEAQIADVDGDGKVTVTDCTIMLRVIKNIEILNSNIETFTVTFKDYNGTVLKTEEVNKGESATAPINPARDGYTFTGWDKEFTNITEDVVVTAKYEEITEPTIIVKDVIANPGDKDVEVILSIKNNPGILGMQLNINYNEEVMTLKNAVNGEAMNNVLTLTKSKVLESGCNFNWDGEDISDEQIVDGTILILTFDIAENVEGGSYPIGFVCNEAVDSNIEAVNLNIKNGSIIINK